jgi:hypothetical protein
MPCDLKEELAIAASISELPFGRWAKWKPAEHERTSVVSEMLLAGFPLFADEGDGLELTKPELCDAER